MKGGGEKLKDECQSAGFNTTSKIRLPVRHAKKKRKKNPVAQQGETQVHVCVCDTMHI